jgi:hypothetical protein
LLSKVKSNYDKISSKAAAAAQRPQIKTSRGDQDTKTRQGGDALACLLGWLLLGWILLGSYAWIGSENSVQDSQKTPQGVIKVK